MQQRASFQKLRTFATAQKYTPDQIRFATKDQIQSQLNLTDDEVKEYRHFWPGMKRLILHDALERQLQERLLLFKSHIEPAYPDADRLTTDKAKLLATELMPYLYGEI